MLEKETDLGRAWLLLDLFSEMLVASLSKASTMRHAGRDDRGNANEAGTDEGERGRRRRVSHLQSTTAELGGRVGVRRADGHLQHAGRGAICLRCAWLATAGPVDGGIGT